MHGTDGCPACDVLAIQALKARYFRAIDDKDWAGLRRLCTEGLHFEHGVIGTFDDADSTVAAIAARVGDRLTVHHGHDPEVEVATGGRTARAVWSLHSVSYARDGSGMVLPGTASHAYGRYDDRVVRTEEGWRFMSVRLVHAYKQPW